MGCITNFEAHNSQKAHVQTHQHSQNNTLSPDSRPLSIYRLALYSASSATSTSPGIRRCVDWYTYTYDFKCDLCISRFLRNDAIYRPICLASYLGIPYSVYIIAQSWILHPYYESITKWLGKSWRIIEDFTTVTQLCELRRHILRSVSLYVFSNLSPPSSWYTLNASLNVVDNFKSIITLFYRILSLSLV